MQPVYLNHLLVFVDRYTYRALSASGFLNEYFACSEERTTHDQATGMSWTGRYFYGRHTYFEFMNPDKTSWAPRDGLAFGIESEGGSATLARRLEQGTGRDVRRYIRNRRYQDQDIPWFWSVEMPRRDDARLISWVMEYDPGFLGSWAPHMPPRQSVSDQADITRSGFLTRYRAAIGDDLSGRLFRDITSVTVTLPPDEADLLEVELGIYGYVAADSRKGKVDPGEDSETGIEPMTSLERTKLRGPDLEIVVERIPPTDDRDGPGSYRDGPGSYRDGPGSYLDGPGSNRDGTGRNRGGSGQVGEVSSTGGIGGITAFTMETHPVSVTTTHTFGPACRLTVDRTGKAAWSFDCIAG